MRIYKNTKAMVRSPDRDNDFFFKGISAIWNAISLVQVWTRVAVSISYDDNHYTTGTSSVRVL